MYIELRYCIGVMVCSNELRICVVIVIFLCFSYSRLCVYGDYFLTGMNYLNLEHTHLPLYLSHIKVVEANQLGECSKIMYVKYVFRTLSVAVISCNT